MKAQKFTLLLVDDDEAQRLFMERSFAAKGAGRVC